MVRLVKLTAVPLAMGSNLGDGMGTHKGQGLGVSECVNINVALFSYSWAFGAGPRNFEPRSSDEYVTSAVTSLF
ncbi:hypothetical protein TNCV_3391831 [Trichonephila clavipes]|nr:hypothetical protein TNCV_3391831 [Trichonephila clavipes]